MNDRTSASQWDFPTEEDKDKDEEVKGSQGSQTETSSQGDAKILSAPAATVTGLSLTSPPAPLNQPVESVVSVLRISICMLFFSIKFLQ